MIKVLMVISEAPPVKSGISRVAEKLSQGLRKRGMLVEILSLKQIPRYELGEIRLSSMPFKISELKQKLQEFDVVHLHGPVPTFSDSFLLWGLRDINYNRPFLVYTHHAPVDLHLPLLYPMIVAYNSLQERLANLADHVVSSSPSYGQRLSKYVPAHKLSVIPWGVDYERFYSPVETPTRVKSPFTVVYLGQIRPYKGLPVLLNAVSGQEGIRLWVIGDGHYADHCRRQAQHLNLSNITFWGHIPDEEVVQLIRQAHVMVMPSITRSEAFGIALLEGMSAGLVPVASHLPGVADLVGNEGYTFPPGNSSALRDILLRLRDDPILRNHVASVAQVKSRIYSWDRSTFGYERVFSRLISSLQESEELLPVDVTSP